MPFEVQLISLAVIFVIVINFFSNKRLPLLSSKLFTCFIVLAFCHICFELLTLYTIYHIDTISPGFNRLCHQLFIGSMDFMIFFMFLYVDMKARKQKRYSCTEILLRILPFTVAIITVVFGRLEYYIGDKGRYSYGPMAMTVYVTIVIYLFFTGVQIILHREHFGHQEKYNIIYAICTWIIIAIVQFCNPFVLLSSIGIALITLFVYISYENPREYIDYEIPRALNRHAYDVIIDEHLESRKVFAVVNAAIVNDSLLSNSYGSQIPLHILNEIAAILGKEFKVMVYHTGLHHISMIVPKSKFSSLDKIDELMFQTVKDISGAADVRISVLECPAFAKTAEEIARVISFVTHIKSVFPKDSLVWIDQKIIDDLHYQDTIERLVQRAISDDGFDIFYQPVYSTKEERFVSAEALVRLKDTDTVGYVSPEIFIPIAEKRNLIEELGAIVFEKVCRFYKECNLGAFGIKYIEVNLSGKQIVNKQLPGQLLKCTQKYGLSCSCINLEITETAAVNATERMTENMQILAESGFGFSMDDFGTGYSNLSSMQHSKFDLIKLDKSLIWPCFEDNSEEARVILDACINMILHLGKGIVAEGVETKEQADYLTEKGVTYLQGYYFSKPVPEDEYLQLIRG